MQRLLLILFVIILSGCGTIYQNQDGLGVNYKNLGLIPLSVENSQCMFGRNGLIENINKTYVENEIFKAKLECSKNNPTIDPCEMIYDYTFDTDTRAYSIKIDGVDFGTGRCRIAGDGIIEGDWVTGKTLMFTQLHQSGDTILMTHGTGP